jgi:hypothetical protein
MPRALFFCTSIVAAFQLHLAAASPNVEDAPVTPAVSAIAARVGVDAARDRGMFLSDAIRLSYAVGDGRALRGSRAARTGSSDDTAVRVPVPLTAQVWSRAVFHRPVASNELIEAILGDRRAALLAYGLNGVDDETLAYLVEHPTLITFLHERAAGAFAAFGDAFHVSGDHVAVPGGPDAVPLWEAVVHERISAPERFARVLFGESDGRLAYLYGVISGADAAAARFALGTWISDRQLRLERFRRLATVCISNYGEWDVDALPFSRPLSDLAVLLLRLRVLPTGVPAPPASRRFWAEVFDVGASIPGEGRSAAVSAAGAEANAGIGLVDAAWLVEVTGSVDMYSRGDRLDQLAFGQRVFAGEGDGPIGSGSTAEAIEATRSFSGHRMLLLTLERLGVRRPAVYKAALKPASAVIAAGRGRRFWSTAQYQGVLAVLSRMHRAGTIDTAGAERLVLSMASVPLDDDGSYGGRMAEWIATGLAPVLPAGATWEERMAAALAGPPTAASAPHLFWEGQYYRVDLSLAERQRLEAVRAKQGGHTVDLALAIQAGAQRLRQPGLTAAAARAAAAGIAATATEYDAILRRPAVDLLAPGVDAPADGFQWMTRTAAELSKLVAAGELRRAARVGSSLSELADIVLGDALVSIVYALDLGSTDSAALLGANVALRHDFGFGRRDGAVRARMPWSLPRQDFMPGVPWHVSGSLLGLDVALAPLALRRLTLDGVSDAPKLTSIEREAFAVGVNLMVPARLTDRDRDEIAAAVGRGRRRAAAIAAGGESIDTVADALGLDGRRRRVAAWTLEHDPDALVSRFSLAELFTLGGGAPEVDVDAWGPSGVHAWGCVCTRFPPVTAWRILAGRPQLPFMAGTLTDFNLSIIMMMSEMKLPASLTRAVLASAMRDFIDESAPTDSNDWWSLARTARDVRRQRVEDYVAAAAAVDGPLVPEQPGVSPQP